MSGLSSNKVVLGMSGGVDSSVSAYLLKEAGYEVIGITLRLFDGEDDTLAAAEVASRFGFEHFALDMERDFQRCIVEPFLRDYSSAITPNPCIICNEAIKWRSLIDFADRAGADFVATGHYARKEDGKIRRGLDRLKDQAYFLYRLPKNYIRRTLFPLGYKTKDDVVKIAEQLKLKAADRKESTEICFFPKGELREFLESHDITGQSGDFVDPAGEVIGHHDGWTHYTIGQRRGLGVPSQEGRLYVIDIDPKNARITLGPRELVMNREFSVRNCIFHVEWAVYDSREGEIQIRHGGRTAHGEVTRLSKDKTKVQLETPLFAPAPGQSAVFFDEDLVIGGGIINQIV